MSIQRRSDSVRHRLRALATACLGAAAALLTTPAPAQAQWFSPWSVMQDMHTPAMGARQLRQYGRMLSLTPDQAAAADELLAGYEREHRALASRMQEIQKAIEEEYENEEEIDVWREVWPKVLKNFIKKREKLNSTLMEDLKVLLDPGQLARWPEVERLHRRATTLRDGTRAGEQLDLVDLVEGLRLDPGATQSVAPVIEQYSAELDRELAARNAFVEQNLDRFFDVMMTWDEEKMKQLYGEMGKMSQKIVDINRSFSRQIQAALPAERQTEFDRKVMLATYPRIYKRTYATRVIEAAEDLPDLDAAQREAIKGIREAFERDAAAINEKWAAGFAEQEKKQQENPLSFWMGVEEDPRIEEARRQRKELEKKTVDSLRALLTEAQRAKLPDRKWKPEFDLDTPAPKRR
jgi:hypothetical protein